MLRRLVNELEIINKLNSKFIYKADSEVYRIEDYWKGFQEFSDTKKYWVGDCDDYALYLWSNNEVSYKRIIRFGDAQAVFESMGLKMVTEE